MKRYLLFIGIFLITNSAYSQMNGKMSTSYGFDINVKPPIYYDIFITFNAKSLTPRFNLHIKIQNDLLYFTRIEQDYVAEYDIALFVKDIQTKETVFSYLWKEKVIEKNFERTNSKMLYEISSRSFDVNYPAGEYDLHVVLTDETTGNSFKSNRKLKIPDIESSNYFNEIKFLAKN